MKSFEYATPSSVEEATALLGSQWGQTEVLAGGTDLITCLKQSLTAPGRVVSLKNIRDLKRIAAEDGKLRIGSMATLGDLAGDETAQKHFPSLVKAVAYVGSPQMLSTGTVGGDLCQRPRCWYFRNGFGLFGAANGKALVPGGDNRYSAIFGNGGPAFFVSPSSLGPPLIALGATVNIAAPDGKSRSVAAGEFFKTPGSESDRETVLRPDEILTSIDVPLSEVKNATYEIRHRHGLDWPYVTASVAFESSGGVAANAKIVLGHVAPVPWPATGAAQALNGGAVDEAAAAKCGAAATEGAKPLSGNAYKVHMVKAAVKRAVLAAAGT